MRSRRFLPLAVLAFMLAGCVDKLSLPTTTIAPSTPSLPPISSSSSPTSPITTPVGQGYYKGFDFTKTGADMRKQVYNLMMETHTKYTTYDELKQAIPYMEAVPNKPKTIYIFYTNDEYEIESEGYMSFSGEVNREHLWPQSKGAKKNSHPGDDPYLLKPTWKSDNGSRGNKDFSYKSEGGFEPEMDAYKGDTARAIFYGAAHYGPESTFKLQLVDKLVDSGLELGKLSNLLEWNLKFPVNDWELTRNDRGQEYLGNRNPFVDHPQLACQIWGDTNQATRNVCSGSIKPVEPVEPTAIQAEDIEMQVEQEKSINAKVEPVNAIAKDFVYSGYDSSVISVSGDKVKGLKVGETDLTIAIKDKPEISKTVKVTVVEKEIPAGAGDSSLTVKTLELTGETYTGPKTVDGIEYDLKTVKVNSENIFIASGGYIYNTTSLGNIEKIVINYAQKSQPSAKAVHGIKFGSSPLTVKPGDEEYDQIEETSELGKAAVTVSPSTAGLGYFRLDVWNKNLQIDSLEIFYSN